MSKLPTNVPLTTHNDYDKQYQFSIDENEQYWAKEAEILDWHTPPTQIRDVSWKKDDLHIKWYEDGELNVCVNCVDSHLAPRSHKTALLWEGNDPSQSKAISYKQLHAYVCQLANGLIDMGIKPGDRVIIYMSMIPELAYAMLACARIGAIHSVVFGGFSALSVASRIDDCQAKAVITADEGIRAKSTIPLKATIDEALTLTESNSVEHVLVVDYRNPSNVSYQPGRDLRYSEFIGKQPTSHEAQAFPAEHPLFILYTSGSTGKPKGLQHSSGGYLVYGAATFRYLFDLKENDVYWTTADLGWVAGHTYALYAPLANGCTNLMFEGTPNHPTIGRFGEIIDKHKVTLFYTAPTAIRTLLAEATTALGSSKRNSLRLLGTVGEPINPEVWQWYHDEFGLGQCSIIDTWWQTETGATLLSPFPFETDPKPGSAMTPMLGIQPEIIGEDAQPLQGEGNGHLVMLNSWPGQARTIWGDHQRFYETYFSTYENCYFSGDGAHRDAEGHYWITGRVDDVLNVSGHRLGTAEIESAVVSHPNVAEAAIVGYPHPIKNEAIYVYAVAAENAEISPELTQSVIHQVRKNLGVVATPDLVQWCRDLPKTRSGKIMRRILRKIAANEYESLGDISTIADVEIVDEIIQGRLNKG